MALRTHFEQTKIGGPNVAEFTVQRTELNCPPPKKLDTSPPTTKVWGGVSFVIDI